MANVILKHQVTTGLAPQLDVLKRGEIAINLVDGDIYYRKVTNAGEESTDVVTRLDIAGALSRLADAEITTPAEGQALVYDGTAAKWKNVTLTTANISNFATAVEAILSEAAGDSLQAHSDKLDKLAALETQGTIVQTADGYATRTIESTTLTVTNGNGVAGNPTIEMPASGVTANTYGSATAIPVITVDAQGRVTAASTESISSTLNVAGDEGTDAVALGTDTLTVAGAGGLETAVTDNTITVTAGDTIVKTSGAQTIADTKTFSTAPEISAEMTMAAATDNQAVKVALLKEQTVYTDANEAGATAAVGGIAKGKRYENADILDIINDLLHPYVAPTNIRLSLNEAGGTFEKGVTKTISSGTVSWTAGSQAISKAEILQSSVAVGEAAVSSGSSVAVTITSPVEVDDNTSFTPRVTDATKMTTGSAVSFTFVYPFYHGVIEAATAVDETSVKALTKDVSVKGTKTYTYDTAGTTKKCVIAFSAAYGDLKSVLDPNNFENVDSFIKQTFTITGLDSTAQSYNVYVCETNVASMAFKFSF